jgi:hypothetical protein
LDGRNRTGTANRSALAIDFKRPPLQSSIPPPAPSSGRTGNPSRFKSDFPWVPRSSSVGGVHGYSILIPGPGLGTESVPVRPRLGQGRLAARPCLQFLLLDTVK